MFAATLRDGILIAERPQLAQDLDELIIFELPVHLINELHRQANLLCGPGRRQIGHRIGQLESQLSDERRIDSGLLDFARNGRCGNSAALNELRHRLRELWLFDHLVVICCGIDLILLVA